MAITQQAKNSPMNLASKLAAAVTRIINNNIVIDVCLLGSFAALGMRSLNQQKYIEELEAEKGSLLESNMAMKRAMWDWKQQLNSEASSSGSKPLVPLSRIKAIYGDAPSSAGDSGNEKVKSPSSKFVI